MIEISDAIIIYIRSKGGRVPCNYAEQYAMTRQINMPHAAIVRFLDKLKASGRVKTAYSKGLLVLQVVNNNKKAPVGCNRQGLEKVRRTSKWLLIFCPNCSKKSTLKSPIIHTPSVGNELTTGNDWRSGGK